MSFPLMNKRARQGVVIPELSGGLNLRDSVSMVNDNQLTDSVNMWFKDGVLKTRPGIATDANYKLTRQRVTNPENHYFKTHRDITVWVESAECTLASYVCITNESVTITFYWLNTQILLYDTFINTGNISIEMKSEGTSILVLPTVNHFVIKHKDNLYCFVKCTPSTVFQTENTETAGTESTEIFGIYKYELNADSPKWTELSEDNIHVPTVYTHCKPTAKGFSKEATQFEGFNLLTPYYKMVFSTVNLTEDVHNMRYNLGVSIPLDKTATITAVLTNPASGEETTHTVEWLGKGTDGTAFETTDHSDDDNLYMFVNRGYVMFSKEKGKPVIATLGESDYLEDNLVITSICDISESDFKKVFSMTRAEWFGGTSTGLNGGTRLFLGGNTEESEKSLVLWSELENPLYFPENCYAYVGNNMQAVTAFGKQSDMLVIFKENETYFTQYNKNDGITADNLIDQSVVDYTANSVYFPLTLIHSGIGCDCPDTVQLCRNRLVWANSNGKVYTLTSANQYSERNIYEVGEMIERKLKTEAGLKYATSCDWEGHYVLFVNNHAYLMGYNSSGYQYAYSYRKHEDANIRIPWWVWELCFDNNAKIVPLKTNGYFAITESSEIRFRLTLHRFSTESSTDKGFADIENDEKRDNTVYDYPIHSTLTTKLFDFGAPGYRKNVDLVQLSLGNNGGTPISVDFVTDCGTVTEEITLESNETENYTAGYISGVALNPSIRSVLRFGVRLSCEGTLAVDGMTLNYRLLGDAR